MKKKTYAEKLRDPRWQRKRLEVMQRDDFKCRDCGSNKETLTVHHIAYEFRKDPWEYADHMLITLCDSCHHDAEARRKFILTETGDPKRQKEVVHFLMGVGVITSAEIDAKVKKAMAHFDGQGLGGIDLMIAEAPEEPGHEN